MKDRIEISSPPKPAGWEEGHLLKCLETHIMLTFMIKANSLISKKYV